MLRRVAGFLGVFVGLVSPAVATSARPIAEAPSWTSYFVGANIGGAWAEGKPTFAPNDPVSTIFFGNFGIDTRPALSRGISLDGVTGGIEVGADRQFGTSLVVGLAADLSLSSLSGRRSATDGTDGFGASEIQALRLEQQVKWWGSLRARVGWLATPDLLIYATGGLAYGAIERSTTYVLDGAFGTIGAGTGGFSAVCSPGATCFAGSTTRTELGGTIGAGAEWRWSTRWAVKAEYLYVNLGKASVDAFALRIAPGNVPASYRASLDATDFHVARVGVNYRF